MFALSKRIKAIAANDMSCNRYFQLLYSISGQSKIEQLEPSHVIASWEELPPTICYETIRYQYHISFWTLEARAAKDFIRAL
jgi:hypothetical protein